MFKSWNDSIDSEYYVFDYWINFQTRFSHEQLKWMAAMSLDESSQKSIEAQILSFGLNHCDVLLILNI